MNFDILNGGVGPEKKESASIRNGKEADAAVRRGCRDACLEHEALAYGSVMNGLQDLNDIGKRFVCFCCACCETC